MKGILSSDKRNKAIDEIINSDRFIINRDGTMFRKVANHLVECGYADKDGYMYFTYKQGIKIRLHRIIYRKFIGELVQGLVINHKDGNTLNNSVDNLEQITQAENNLHRFRVLKRKPVAGRTKFREEDVKQMKEMREKGKTYKQIMEVFNISKSNLSYIINNKTWNKETIKPKRK